MTPQIISELEAALADYRSAIGDTSLPADMADYRRLVSITEQIIDKLKSDVAESAKSLSLAFSRCVTDSFAVQPREYMRLSKAVNHLK